MSAIAKQLAKERHDVKQMSCLTAGVGSVIVDLYRNKGSWKEYMKNELDGNIRSKPVIGLTEKVTEIKVENVIRIMKISNFLVVLEN